MCLTAFVLHVEYTCNSMTTLKRPSELPNTMETVSPSRNNKYQSGKEAGLAFALSN